MHTRQRQTRCNTRPKIIHLLKDSHLTHSTDVSRWEQRDSGQKIHHADTVHCILLSHIANSSFRNWSLFEKQVGLKVKLWVSMSNKSIVESICICKLVFVGGTLKHYEVNSFSVILWDIAFYIQYCTYVYRVKHLWDKQRSLSPRVCSTHLKWKLWMKTTQQWALQLYVAVTE